MWGAMMWKSTNSNGWEYFGCVKGLGLESYVCQLCVILIMHFCYILNAWRDGKPDNSVRINNCEFGWIGCT